MGRYTQQFIDNGYDDREVIQELCEEDLAKAQPYLDEADRAANSIKPSDLNELKNARTPQQ